MWKTGRRQHLQINSPSFRQWRPSTRILDDLPVWAKEIEFYEVKGGVLYRHEPSTKINRRNHVNYQVVLPLSLRPLILKEFHDELTSGHLAFSRTYLKVKNHYYWPTMRKDIKEYCTTCPVCIANTRSPFRTPLYPHKLATAPFQVLGMDFIGPITPVSPYRNSYIMVVTDYFSKMGWSCCSTRLFGSNDVRRLLSTDHPTPRPTKGYNFR